jgi:hypothetical protein
LENTISSCRFLENHITSCPAQKTRSYIHKTKKPLWARVNKDICCCLATLLHCQVCCLLATFLFLDSSAKAIESKSDRKYGQIHANYPHPVFGVYAKEETVYLHYYKNSKNINNNIERFAHHSYLPALVVVLLEAVLSQLLVNTIFAKPF